MQSIRRAGLIYRGNARLNAYFGFDIREQVKARWIYVDVAFCGTNCINAWYTRLRIQMLLCNVRRKSGLSAWDIWLQTNQLEYTAATCCRSSRVYFAFCTPIAVVDNICLLLIKLCLQKVPLPSIAAHFTLLANTVVWDAGSSSRKLTIVEAQPTIEEFWYRDGQPTFCRRVWPVYVGPPQWPTHHRIDIFTLHKKDSEVPAHRQYTLW